MGERALNRLNLPNSGEHWSPPQNGGSRGVSDQSEDDPWKSWREGGVASRCSSVLVPLYFGFIAVVLPLYTQGRHRDYFVPSAACRALPIWNNNVILPEKDVPAIGAPA